MRKLVWCIVILLASGISVCNCSNNSAMNRIVQKDQVSIYGGKVIGKAFINKVGDKNPRIIDLYFEINGEAYFIKFIESRIKRDDILKHMDKRLEIRGTIGYGLWDTDDPNVQSRVGKYVVIYEIVK